MKSSMILALKKEINNIAKIIDEDYFKIDARYTDGHGHRYMPSEAEPEFHLLGKIRNNLGDVIRKLAELKEMKLKEENKPKRGMGY